MSPPAATTTATAAAAAAAAGDLSGAVAIDGSSTVFPFAQAAAEGFQGENPNAKVTVGESGTGGGFEKFCAGEIDIADASRPIDEEEEVPVCEKSGVEYTQVQVANDGIAVVSNPALKIDVPDDRSAQGAVEQGLEGLRLRRPRRRRSRRARSRSTARAPTPARSTSSPRRSTARRATRATTTSRPRTTTCSSRASRATRAALGYFGFSYYEDNADKLNLIAVDGGDGCVKPSKETIQDGSYKPLARPLFMYPSNESMTRKPQVKGFMDYTVANAIEIAETANIVPLTDAQLTEAKAAVPAS